MDIVQAVQSVRSLQIDWQSFAAIQQQNVSRKHHSFLSNIDDTNSMVLKNVLHKEKNKRNNKDEEKSFMNV